jgi:hypothetical protein
MARVVQQSLYPSVMGIAEGELQPGEKLVWAERPQAMALARRHMARSLIGIPFTAFAVFWTWMAYTGTRKGAPGAFATFFPALGG